MRNGKPVILLVHPKLVEGHSILDQFESWTAGSLNFYAVRNADEAVDAIEELKQNPDLGTDPNNWLMACVTILDLPNFDGKAQIDSIAQTYAKVLRVFISEDAHTPIPTGYRRLIIDADTLDRQFRVMFDAWEPPDPWVYLEGSRETLQAREYQDLLYTGGKRYTFAETGAPEITVKVRGEDLGKNPPVSQLYAKLCEFPESERKPTQYPYDLVVVGAGPSGMAAALSAGQLELQTLVLEGYVLGGTAATSINMIENYLGFPKGLSGNRLATLVLDQMKNQEISGIDWWPLLRAHSLQRESSGRYHIMVDPVTGEHVSAGVVILACGQSPSRLKIEDDSTQHFESQIHYIALRSHKERERNKEIVIVGGGDSAGQAALMFSAPGEARRVTLVSRDPLKRYMNPRLIRKVRASRVVTREEYEVARFIGDEKTGLREVEIKKKDKNGVVIDIENPPATSTYVLIGGKPETKWLESSGITLERNRRIPTDMHLPTRVRRRFKEENERNVLTFETSLPGVFSVGDVRSKSSRRVAQAAGQGAAVLSSIEEYLRNQGGKVLIASDSPAFRIYGPAEER